MPRGAGKYRHVIKFAIPVKSDTARGDITLDYPEYADAITWYAQIELMKNSSINNTAYSPRGNASHRITFRKNTAVTMNTRIYWKDANGIHVYEIGFIGYDGINTEMFVDAIEIKGEQ